MSPREGKSHDTLGGQVSEGGVGGGGCACRAI